MTIKKTMGVLLATAILASLYFSFALMLESFVLAGLIFLGSFLLFLLVLLCVWLLT